MIANTTCGREEPSQLAQRTSSAGIDDGVPLPPQAAEVLLGVVDHVGGAEGANRFDFWGAADPRDDGALSPGDWTA